MDVPYRKCLQHNRKATHKSDVKSFFDDFNNIAELLKTIRFYFIQALNTLHSPLHFIAFNSLFAESPLFTEK